MSSIAAQRGPGQQVRARLAPWLDGSALDRARLTLVADRRTSAARLPFVLLVSLILVGGVVGLLCFNTSMQQAAFTENRLQEQATNLAAREQALQLQLQSMQSAHAIAVKAQRLGMVVAARPALLHVPSGKVQGSPEPAGRDATPPLYPRLARPKPVLAPARTASDPTSDATGGATSHTTAAGTTEPARTPARAGREARTRH